MKLTNPSDDIFFDVASLSLPGFEHDVDELHYFVGNLITSNKGPIYESDYTYRVRFTNLTKLVISNMLIDRFPNLADNFMSCV